MAIDEKHLGDLAPQESAVDRLRKRNRRIRPWEGALVDGSGSPAIPKPEVPLPSGRDTLRADRPEVTPPSGQITQRADEPEVISPIDVPESASNPEGAITSGLDALRLELPLVDSTSGQNNLSAGNPEVRLTSGGFDPVDSPSGQIDLRVSDPEPPAEARVKLASGNRNPRGRLSDQRAKQPEVVLPTGENNCAASTLATIDESGGFDPRAFLPASLQDLQWREKGTGRLIIPHRLCEFLNYATTTRNELLVLTCLVRFSLGFHRNWCEAGYSFIARWTGISDVANVRRSVKNLLELGIIRKTEEHDCASNSGSVYEVPVVQAYLTYLIALKNGNDENRQGSLDRPVVVSPSGSNDQRVPNQQACGQNTHRPEVETTTKKESTNDNSNETLSSRLPTILNSYLQQIGAPTKRENEQFFLYKLLANYDSHQIEISLSFILANGTLGSREKCHSPLKYLATAMDQILPKAVEAEHRVELAKAVSRIGETDNINNLDKNTKRPSANQFKAFEQQLSEQEKSRYRSIVISENSHSGYQPPLNVIESLAVTKWLIDEKIPDSSHNGRRLSENLG
jgi:hypothetical protein